MYNMLSNSSNMQQLEANVNVYLNQLHPTDRHYYLTNIPDKKQYAVACCNMAPDICMYGKTASFGGIELRKQVCPSETVDLLNAATLLLKLKGKRHNKRNAKA